MTSHLPRVKAHLSLHAHRKVRGLLEGEYLSTLVGRSMELNDLREYVRGDDVRDLEWKASARSGQLLVKRFVATRRHTVLLVVSTGRSMAAVDDAMHPKRDLAVFVAGVLGWLAVRNGDRVALVHGDADGVRMHPPGAGEARLERALGAVHDATTATSAPAHLASLLEHTARAVRRRTILVVVTDEHPLDPPLVAALRRATAQHEVLYVTVGDLDPTRGRGARLTDVGSGRAVPVWAHDDARLAQEFSVALATENAARKQVLDRLGIAHERILDEQTALRSLHRLLERHRRGRRR